MGLAGRARIRCNRRHYLFPQALIFDKRQWNDDARNGLARTFGEYGPDDVRQWIESGRCELWRVDTASWLITEVRDNALFVWNYEGQNAVALADSLLRIAKKNGLRAVQFVTHHKGLPRMLRRLGFQTVGNDADLIKCEAVTNV